MSTGTEVLCAIAVAAIAVVARGLAAGRGDAEGAARWAGIAAAAYGSEALAAAAGGDWMTAAVGAALAAFWFWLWRRGRRNRKRSLRALGNKARARLAAMAGNMPKPGPVLRPVPQGSGT